MLAIAVGGQIGHIGTGLAAGNQVQHGSCGNRTQYLGDDVARQLSRTETPCNRQTYRHRRVEVTTRDGAKGISTGQHRQTEGKRDTQQADTHIGESRCQHCAAATAKREPERAQKFRRPFFDIGCHDYSPAP